MGLAIETLRQREMYLHLLFLISTAFWAPSSARNEIEDGIYLREAEKDFHEINAELRTLGKEGLTAVDYFPAFIQAKRQLRVTRENVRKLAQRNVNEVKDLKVLVEGLDKSNNTLQLEVSLDRMKDLMKVTLETSKGAQRNYNSALRTLENLSSSIEQQNKTLEKLVTKGSAEYQAWTEELRGGIYGTIAGTTTACIVADALGALGICSAINAIVSGSTAAAVETEITKYAAKLEQLKAISERLLEEDKFTNYSDVLDEEFSLIKNWTNNAEVVKKSIDRYPKEYLKRYVIRTVFVNRLDDLQNSAQDFVKLFKRISPSEHTLFVDLSN